MFAVQALALTLLMLAGVMATNVAVDPRAEFGSFLGLRPLVPDAAADKLALYRALSEPPAAVVIGSSRALALPPDVLGPGSFNFAVEGAGVQDTVLVGRFLLEDPHLEHLVLNVDVFGITEGKVVRLVRSEAAEELTGQPRQLSPPWRTLPQTLSVAYSKDTTKVVLYTLEGYPSPQAVHDADGLQHRPVSDTARAAGTYDLDAAVAQQYSAEQIPAFAGERGPPDPEVLADLRSMAQDALDRGLRIDVFFPPYQPEALTLLEMRPAFHDRVQFIKDALGPLCADGLHFFDFTDGAAIGLDPQGYYDGHHVTPENGRRILQAIDAGQGDLCATDKYWV